MQYLNETGLKAFWNNIMNWTRTKHGQSISKGTATQAGIPLNLMNGADTPTALGATVTITKDDITALGIPGSNTTYTDATQTAHGLMSAADKKKLDGVAEGANKYVHPTSAAGAKAAGLYRVATDAQGHVTSAVAVAKADITALGIPGSQPTVPGWVANPKGSDITVDGGDLNGMTVSEGLQELSDSIAGKQAVISDLETIRSGATKGATAVQTETDPTVPAWAKAATKPDYDTDEIASASASFDGDTLTEVIDKLNTKDGELSKSVESTRMTLDRKANLSSPSFSGTPTAPTAAAGTNTTQVATCAFVGTAVANALTGAAKYQGGMTAASYSKLTTYKAGWYWVVTEAGTIAGESCEVGDMVWCNTDNAAAGTKKDAHFDIVQNNIDAIPLSVINALS